MASTQQQVAPQPQPVTSLAANASMQDGALFGLPGVTIWSDQKENNSGVSNSLAIGSQTPINFPANFKQTDVVWAWRMQVIITQTTISGNAGQVLSPYFPYNFIGPMSLNVQNQFDTFFLFNGYDAILFQVIRPQRQTSWPQNFGDQSPAFDAYDNATNAGNWQPTRPGAGSAAFVYNSASVFFDIDLLPGIWFDLYYDLEENGQLYSNKAMGVRAFVSPLMMAGTNRVIQPRLTFNQTAGIATSATADIAPVTYTTLPTTSTISAAVNFRRTISYQPQSSKDAPLLFSWQYSRQCIRNTIGAQTQITISLPLVGQILSFYIRMWDPGTAPGAPVSLNTVTEADVQIGSGLFRFQDTVEDNQSRFYRQHGIKMPDGVLVWDMATLPDGRISNRDAINTLTTSGCQVVITFNTAPSASAYYVLGYEALRYVALQ